MSALTRYAAHAELTTAVHRTEDVEMLTEMHDADPELFAYPVSGDMLTVAARAGRGVTTRRRRRAAAVRSGDEATA